MNTTSGRLFSPERRLSQLDDSDDIPTEALLWDMERLQRHARQLADERGASLDSRRLDLTQRLKVNALALESAYARIVEALQARRAITPAAEWIVDNFHVVTEQLSDIPLRLTVRVWRDLPAANHPAAQEWPRILHLAVEYLRHTLWDFQSESLQRFLAGYQQVAPLKMQELWALYPILRIALIEELGRIARRVEESLASRAAADATADSLVQGNLQELPGWESATQSQPSGWAMSAYVVQLAHRLQAMGERGRPFLNELAAGLSAQGTSIDDYIQRQHARRSASNLAARNIITSLRTLTSFNWRALFEKTSRVELLLRTQPSYADCDRRTRDRYRNVIEELAAATDLDELGVTQQTLALQSARQLPEPQAQDLGTWLIGPNRALLEAALDFPVSPARTFKRWVIRHSHGLYLGGIAALALMLIGLAVVVGVDVRATPWPWILLLAVLAAFPASEVAIGFINRQWVRYFPPRHLPRLALESGLQPEMRTLVVVPTILKTVEEAVAACRQLHVHALANPDGQMSFALLSDWADSATEHAHGDELILAAARREIAALNEAHAADAQAGKKFYLLHRRRQWSAGEHCFMGWERKRGKLEELNSLLLRRGPTSFLADADGTVAIPDGICFVMTVDADTRLPLGCVKDLVGIAAHPLNNPVFSPTEGRVVAGYGVLQPRITPLLPAAEERSLYREIVTSGSGVDPYAAAVSDLNQDVFGEGLFTGKGLYDLKAWEASLSDRVPPNALLSHDLFEGLFARCGLVTDIELFEDFPSHSEVAAARSHRWMRGDWQLLPWIAGLRGPLPPLGRWKMLDNLRRSLLAPCAVALLIAAFAIEGAQPLVWLVVVLGPWLWPALSTAVERLVRMAWVRSRRTQLRVLVSDLTEDLARAAVSLALLAQNCWLSVDAIARAVYRLTVTRRGLLEWVTAAQLKATRSTALSSFVWPLKSASIVVIAAVALLMLANPAGLLAAAPLLVLWWLSPVLAQFLSRPLDAQEREQELPGEVTEELRGIARLTWSFFERFVTAEENHLPPDNFQEDPYPVIAHRTSPTNIGLYLLSNVSARDFGWLGLGEMTRRLSATLQTLGELERHQGHLLNWYDTLTLQPLLPRYVSTVDSGNLAGHLWTLRQACLEMMHGPLLSPLAFRGPRDCLENCRSAIYTSGAQGLRNAGERERVLDALREVTLNMEVETPTLAGASTLLRQAHHQVSELIGTLTGIQDKRVASWLEFAARDIASHLQDLEALPARAGALPCTATLQRLADEEGQTGQCSAMLAALGRVAELCRDLVDNMSFGFLFDSNRGLFSIGYRVADLSLDTGYYDLLASEARLASLVAIAKGDVPRSHWFRLGRRLTGGRRHPILASWSGSMFEYLMPALVMHEPRRSLLGQTNGRAVRQQVLYGLRHDLPWGISESAYHIRDRQFTYQYSSFGLPTLGLKRGLASDYVAAPYATALAAMFVPEEASENFRALEGISGRGEYGFYEALDFTAARIPEGQSVAVVRAYMAHHQGMSLVALNNVLHGRIMQARFHNEPRITAADLLLQERSIRFVEAPELVEADVPVSSGLAEDLDISRTVQGYQTPTPQMHLLSNRTYSVMVTDSGAGFSTCRSRAVTRWREDATRDCWGSFIYLQEPGQARLWSAGFQPTLAGPDDYHVEFNEESVVLSRRDGSLRSVLTVVVAPSDDGELRRLKLYNDGLRPRLVEVTSYAEIVLAPQRADVAHPGFSNLFIQTEYDAATGALLATRRPRSAREAPVWAMHVIAGSGAPGKELQYETDRARFLGRGGSPRLPLAMQASRPLSNTVGNVLDPIFSLRTRILVPARGSASVTFATFVATSREQALSLVEKYRTPRLFEHVCEAAWTFARAELYYLQSSLGEAMLFQTLASHLLVATAQVRASGQRPVPNTLDATHLWRFSISGDRPLLVIRCHSQDEMGFVEQCLRAQEYLRVKRLVVDVVVLNELSHSYVQDLQQSIERTVRAFALQVVEGEERGGIYALACTAMSEAERSLLFSLARVILDPAQGGLAEQLRRPPAMRSALAAAPEPESSPDAVEAQPAPHDSSLEFFNGWGGFGLDGREYVLSLARPTPAPWSNILANEQFGSLVTERGAMCTWSANARENQLTSWSNDAVSDPSGEAFYLLEEESEELWSATSQPIRREGARYEVRHGQGYSRFGTSFRKLDSSLTVFVTAGDPVKLCRLRLHNRATRPRRITVISYVEWALGATRSTPAHDVQTQVDGATGAQFARNPALIDFGSRIAFCDMGGRQQHSTSSRLEFLGRNGSPESPAGVRHFRQWEHPSHGRDPCCAFAVTLELAPGASDELLFMLGQGADEAQARELIQRYRALEPDVALGAVKQRWNTILGAIQIRTPDRALDLMFNRWLLYQTLACRFWARAAFYQAGGAFGFRDQLQDGMALSWCAPEQVRAHLLQSASRQFVEGDVQHWWHPPSGRGVRTHFSDDRLWLPLAAHHYIQCTGDAAVLEEVVGFIEGPALPLEQEDAHYVPGVSSEQASLYEHCARALDVSLKVGAHGLPLMGGGDWNDGMNRVGHEGRGESVWLAWFLITVLRQFVPIARTRGDLARAQRWSDAMDSLARACEREAWDGQWYRRAFFDDGTPLGSATNTECQIDSLSQSWAVLSGAADPARARTAMKSLQEKLVRRDDGLVLLFTPPFDAAPVDPGYIKGYLPGLRENGGQFTHAAMWVLMAQARLRNQEQVAELLEMLNPVHRSATPEGVATYRVEPYAVASDIYSGGSLAGRGGWTWYTGAAGWFYRSILESVLGLQIRADSLQIDPCVPAEWDSFEVAINLPGIDYQVNVRRTAQTVTVLLFDGAPQTGNLVPLVRDGQRHLVELLLRADDVPG